MIVGGARFERSSYVQWIARLALCGLLACISCWKTEAQEAVQRGWPGPGQLFVGTCYQPIDRSPAQIQSDIVLMKKAGFNIVRMGDLSWDSFEPRQGVFEFAWFDSVMDQMQANGIKVILDIPGSIAPIWLHRKYPGVDIIAQNGTRLPPARRYMDDISDPDYVREVGIMADALTKHYAHNPAVIAVGYDNEIGSGMMSYSEADRQRFITWLKHKYGSIEALNKAWATQRWSRRVNSFEDIDLPLGNGPVPPERYLDLHRYWSDVTIARLKELDAIRRRNMPDKPAVSNLWPNSPKRGFDYLSSMHSYVSFGAMGFYPKDPVSGAMDATLVKGDLNTPIWFDEFTAGRQGFYGLRGKSRMYAYLGLLLGEQAVLAWTFNSQLGGEEQMHVGLLDHDGSPSWKLDEFSRIAKEFAKLQKLGFPRYPHPDVAIAYSFDSFIAADPKGAPGTTQGYVTRSYEDQIEGAFEPLFRDNIDVAILNVAYSNLSRYKLIVLPCDYVMDPASAEAIRAYVAQGGTVLMTAFSAKVDQHSQWFGTPLPGLLSDVFGLKTNAFYTADRDLTFDLGATPVDTGVRFYEVLEPSTARVIARFTNTEDKTPAITVNAYGKGKAVYLATESASTVMGPVLRYLYGPTDIHRGPTTPEGVYARTVDGRTLYVNTNRAGVAIPIAVQEDGVLSGKTFDHVLTLGPLDAELVMKRKRR